MKQTEIILLQRVSKLGKLGDIVKVRRGFANNFLIKKNMALRATEDNLAFFQEKKELLIAKNQELKNDAESRGDALRGTVLTLIRHAGDNGHLYGSVSSKDLAHELDKIGHKISSNQIDLHKPIKELGVFSASLEMHADVVVPIVINVAKSQDEAKSQFEQYLEESKN